MAKGLVKGILCFDGKGEADRPAGGGGEKKDAEVSSATRDVTEDPE